MEKHTSIWNELYGSARFELVEQPRQAALQVIEVHLKKGSIKPEACDVCSHTVTIPYFADYDFPLDVIWFCRPHLKQLEAANAQNAWHMA